MILISRQNFKNKKICFVVFASIIEEVRGAFEYLVDMISRRHSCADPENFVIGGPTLTTFFFLFFS